MPNLITVRHGETEWSRDGRHTGRTDVALTRRGREQAAAAGERLDGRRFAVVLTSPRARAVDTCALAGYGEAAVIDADLQEWDYGDYEGLTSAEINAMRPGWSLWRDGCLGGESVADVAARADRVVERARASDGDVIVFAHGHVLRVIGARWVDAPVAFGARLQLGTAAISELGWEHGVPSIVRWGG